MKTLIFKFYFEIDDPQVYDLIAASKLDKSSKDFVNFEESLDLIFQLHGYELTDTYDSPKDKSCTRYYTYVKIEGGTKLKAFVSVRVSDHFSRSTYDKDGNRIPEYKARNQFVAMKAKNLAKELGSDNKYLARSVNIVFNGTKFDSYDSALEDVKDKIESYDEMIQ